MSYLVELIIDICLSMLTEEAREWVNSRKLLKKILVMCGVAFLVALMAAIALPALIKAKR